MVEQSEPLQFNRAMLLNIGFLEALGKAGVGSAGVGANGANGVYPGQSVSSRQGERVKEGREERPFDCFVFHDVDLVPEHLQNLYMCTRHVHHLASAIDEMRFHVMFYNYAGGVVAIGTENFWRVNGFANLYWGWGNEVTGHTIQ